MVEIIREVFKEEEEEDGADDEDADDDEVDEDKDEEIDLLGTSCMITVSLFG